MSSRDGSRLYSLTYHDVKSYIKENYLAQHFKMYYCQSIKAITVSSNKYNDYNTTLHFRVIILIMLEIKYERQ